MKTAAIFGGLAIAAATLSVPGAAAAQDWSKSLEYLRDAVGFRQAENTLLFVTGAASAGGSLTYTFVPFNTWAPITAFAQCDDNCSDVDLTILDETGRTVVQDVAENDDPTVTFRPEPGRTYRAVTLIYACTSTCAASTAVFQ